MIESLSLKQEEKRKCHFRDRTGREYEIQCIVVWEQVSYTTSLPLPLSHPAPNPSPTHPHSPQTTSSCWLLQAFTGLCLLFQSRQRQQAFSLITPQTCLFRYPNRRIFNIRSRGRTWACDNHHLHGFSLVQCHIISSPLQNIHTSYNNYKC